MTVGRPFFLLECLFAQALAGECHLLEVIGYLAAEQALHIEFGWICIDRYGGKDAYYNK